MKIQTVPFVRASIGCLFAGLVSMPAFADPFTNQDVADASIVAESRNVPRFKMTYRSLHNASVERREKAEMAALELREKNSNDLKRDATKNTDGQLQSGSKIQQ